MGDHLSRSGAWRFEAGPFTQRHYRWPNLLEGAVAAARAALHTVVIKGVTRMRLQERIVADEAPEGMGVRVDE